MASACRIHASYRSLTSAAISPSPKLRCKRRASITPRSPRRRGVRAQQHMVKFANLLNGVFQVPIVAQPATHLGNSIGMQAELTSAAAGIADIEHPEWMPFATRALGTTLPMRTGRAQEQRTTQHLAGDGQATK